MNNKNEKNVLLSSNAKEGYYSNNDLKQKERKEKNSLFFSDNYTKSHIDMLRFIVNVKSKIENSRDRLIIEKYLMGFTLKELENMFNLTVGTIRGVIKKYKQLLKDEYEDACAIKELFEGTENIYVNPVPKVEVEKDVAKARMLLENLFGFETFIYPFDISENSYKVTIKHPYYGTLKKTPKALVEYVEEIKKAIVKSAEGEEK